MPTDGLTQTTIKPFIKQTDRFSKKLNTNLPMSEIPRNNTGLSGEYFVAAELYRRGWSVGMTLGNAKAVDLFAEKNGKTISVQVKSLFQRKSNGFPLMKKQVKENCYYVLVLLNGNTMSPPDFFICTSSEVESHIKEYETRGILPVKSVDVPDYKGKWEKLEM